ncbi:nose resistant to fluoxetine protein 6, partial [Biomphalaria glabrata]
NSPLDYVTYYYMAPYCRLGPFVTGVVAGYILSSNNGRVSMNKLTLVFGWLFCCAFSIAVVYFGSNLKEENLISVYPAAIHNAVSRSAWGLCVCWIIVACSSGYGGPLNSLLSWSPFTVLSRLSYMVYLLHSNIVSIFFGNLDNVLTFSSLLF